MRILHVANHVEEIGNGIVNVAVDLACLQAQLGHQVAFASGGGQYETLLAKYGVKHYYLDQSRKPLKLVNAVRNFRAITQQFHPDIVHGHMMTGIVLAWLLRSGKNYGLVSTVHNEFQTSSILMGLADRVITVSRAVGSSMIRRGVPQHKVRVVSNANLKSPRNPKIQDCLPLPLARPAITTVAGMYKRKGIRELIDAFIQIAPQFTDAHLYLVGNGPDREEFEAYVRESQYYDRIHFEGFQPHPQRYMLSTDIFVLASHHESFGLVLTEAREAGCAIVASDVDGIPETLDNRQAGILVPPFNSDAIAAALTQLISEPSTLEKWKSLAQQNLERFHVTRASEETLAVYSELLQDYPYLKTV
ncbi:MAG: glycosyltransferase family 4 protein [Calothrix sp. C42_A2020_038]|nr:glycosyltransferase family 4 protein [Calothrix sp. C42_A2020_038]